MYSSVPAMLACPESVYSQDSLPGHSTEFSSRREFSSVVGNPKRTNNVLTPALYISDDMGVLTQFGFAECLGKDGWPFRSPQSHEFHR